MPNQYENESNFLAHYESTGPEIWEQTNGKITHFLTGCGTGGTMTGTGSFLKEKDREYTSNCNSGSKKPSATRTKKL